MTQVDTSDTSDGGNTKPHRAKRERARKWVMTLNNYSEEEYNNLIKDLTQKHSSFILGREIGENNTPHLQCYAEFKNAISFDSLKKINQRMHVEKAKGNLEQNYKYCSKDGNYYTNIEIPEDEDTKILNKRYKNIQWRDWQQNLLDLVETEPDTRTIHWIYDPVGNNGKSFLVKYLDIKYNICLGTGKKEDIFHQIAKHYEEYKAYPKIVVVDIPRCQDSQYISYGALEAIKNGHIFSGKYEGAKMRFLEPHVIVFSNDYPDITKFSDDRLKITQISKVETIKILVDPDEV